VRRNSKKFIIGLITVIYLSVGSGSDIFAGVSREEKEELKSTHHDYRVSLETDELTESASLADVLRYGALNNSALKVAFYMWKASVHAIKRSTAWDDPQISIKTFIDEVETRVGPQQEIYSVSQKLYFPGKLYTQGKAATAFSRQQYAEYQNTRLNLFYEIKDTYLEYWYLHKNILVTEKNMELLKRFEGVAQSKYKASLTSNQDLLKAQVELGKLDNTLLRLHDFRDPLSARLNALLNRDSNQSIGWPEAIDHEVVVLDEANMFEIFYQNNPDLKRALERIEETSKRVWFARLNYLPDVTVGFDYINVSKGPMNVSDNGKNASALMFKVNVPLWFGKQKSQLDEAASLKTSAQAAHTQLENDLAAKIKMVYFKVRDAGRQIQLYRNALVPKAEQSLKASETAYSAGKVDFLNLIDSQRTLLNFQLAYYQAIRNYEQQFAELEMIIGEPLRGRK
jgi:cobalt-zinc-cadmium efflux system outer membrane protein